MTKIAPQPHVCWGVWAAVCLSGLLSVTTHAASRQPAPCDHAVLTLSEAADLLRIVPAELDRLAEGKEVPARRIGAAWRFSCTALMSWLAGDAWPTMPMRGDLAAVTAAGPGQAGNTPSASAPLPAGRQDAPIGDAPEERAADDIFLRGQRVLLRRGEAVVDIGEFYARSGDYQMASVEGGVALATVEQEVLTTFVVGRLGIFQETELFASTTFNRHDTRLFQGNTNLAARRRTAFGSTGVGIRHAVLRESAGRPDVIISLNGQIPTGDSSSAIGTGLVLVKSIDPVVLFANSNYRHAYGRSSRAATRLDPQNSIDVSMGYGLGLNDTVAISMAVSGLFTGPTNSGNATSRQPAIFSGRFGLTTRLAGGLYIEPSVSFGLSGPGNSFAFGVTMPYAF